MNSNNNILYVALFKISKNVLIDKYCVEAEKKVKTKGNSI